MKFKCKIDIHKDYYSYYVGVYYIKNYIPKKLINSCLFRNYVCLISCNSKEELFKYCSRENQDNMINDIINKISSYENINKKDKDLINLEKDINDRLKQNGKIFTIEI